MTFSFKTKSKAQEFIPFTIHISIDTESTARNLLKLFGRVDMNCYVNVEQTAFVTDFKRALRTELDKNEISVD